MANSYLQFCQRISHLTDAEILWFRHATRDVKILSMAQFKRLIKEEPWRDSQSETAGFDFGVEIWDDAVRIHSGNESGDVDAAARLLQAFLKAFRPKEYLYITWCVYSDKLRPDAFSGGLEFITAKKIWSSASVWEQRGFLEQYFLKHGKLPRDFFALEPEKKMGRFARAPADQIVNAAGWDRNTLLILMERFINMCGGEDAFRSYLARLAAGEEANDA